MAKLGEGDTRWIVEERADGKNVGGWHWQERDVLPWAQRRLRELLGGADVVAPSSSSPSSSTFKTGPEVETSGEAVVNSRKGKLIPAYELTLKGTWKEEGDEDKRGDWEIYLADENQGDDPEIKTSVAPGAGEAAEESARRFRDAAKVGIVPKLRDFVKELAAGGGPGGGGSDGASAGGAAAEGKAAPANKSEPAAAAAAVAAAPKSAAPAPKPAAAPSSSKDATTATTTLKLTEKFYCRPSDLFEALTDPRKVMAFTQAPAEIEGPPFRVGNKYSIFAGAVEAKFAEGTDAERHRIELDWRFKEWPDAAMSRVSIRMREPSEGLTELTLVQSGIPSADRFGGGGVPREVAEAGWRGRIFGRIRGVFGYGVGL